MTIIVEDGSGIPNANSYVSLVDARGILNPLGQDLNANDITAEQEILNGMNYIESFSERYQGIKTNSDQLLQWPRLGVLIYDNQIDSNVIPQNLINGQVFAAYEFSQGNVLQPTVDGRSRASAEVVGGVKVSYFDTGAMDGLLIYVRINDSLNPLFNIFSLNTLVGLRG